MLISIFFAYRGLQTKVVVFARHAMQSMRIVLVIMDV